MIGSKFTPGERVAVWIVQDDRVQEGDLGTVLEVREGLNGDDFYVDVVLDTGVRMGNYHEFTFVSEEEYKRGKS